LTADEVEQETWVLCDTLFTPFQRQTNWLLEIRQGKIRRMSHARDFGDALPKRLIHVPGAIVTPGLVDLHVHGASGHDVMEASADALQTISRALASHGTTAFLATTMSADDSCLEAVLRAFAAHRHLLTSGAAAIGIHMEGPYLSPLRRGAHDAAFLKTADVAAFLRFVEASNNTVRKVTIAPEVDPDLQLIRTAGALGIQVSLGHSNATDAQARAAVDAGARQTTHTFNAMSPLHQREPGLLGVALTDDRIYTEVIADGVHVHPTVLKLLLQAKGVERTVLVTDGSSATGMPNGKYPLGSKSILVEDGVCRDDAGHLAGSTLTLDRAVRNLVDRLDVPLHEALIAASATPARCMGIENKGVLQPGADADLVFFGRDLRVLQTMVAGRVVYVSAVKPEESGVRSQESE
jgi:N-acetylglucosamine-6-phosphate deacetylase